MKEELTVLITDLSHEFLVYGVEAELKVAVLHNLFVDWILNVLLFEHGKLYALILVLKHLQAY